MDKRRIRQIVLLLFVISVVIYGLQILIFRDPNTTAFYLFQDFAFMPVTIAIATLVVGELLGEQEKRNKIQKTKMLANTFFSEVGTKLLKLLLPVAEPQDRVRQIVTVHAKNETELREQLKEIRSMDIQVHLTEEIYEQSIALLKGARTSLMILSSNPMLMEHEDFTDLLWTLFHISDEYDLRGSYQDLSQADRNHMDGDFAGMLRLLLANFVLDVQYIKEMYPNLYLTAREKTLSR